MGSERFHAEGFGSVVSSENQIDAELFGGNRGPMRRFAGDEHVDLFLRDTINFRAGAAGNDPNCFGSLRTKAKALTFPPNDFSSLRKSSLREMEARVFNPVNCPFSSKNGVVDLSPSAAASCALLPTFG